MSDNTDLTLKDIYRICTIHASCAECPIHFECNEMQAFKPYEWAMFGGNDIVGRPFNPSKEQSEDYGTESVGQGDSGSSEESVGGDEAVQGRYFEGSPDQFWEDSVCGSGVISTFFSMDNSGTDQTDERYFS